MDCILEAFADLAKRDILANGITSPKEAMQRQIDMVPAFATDVIYQSAFPSVYKIEAAKVHIDNEVKTACNKVKTAFKMVSISETGECKLISMSLVELKNLQRVTLDGFEGRKLGIFITMDGEANSTARKLINMLRFPSGVATAGNGACGIAYMYEDEMDMTTQTWRDIQMLCKSKRRQFNYED